MRLMQGLTSKQDLPVTVEQGSMVGSQKMRDLAVVCVRVCAPAPLVFPNSLSWPQNDGSCRRGGDTRHGDAETRRHG